MQLVELKNGETYNGHMVQCDSWMNVRLREVICTSKVRCEHKDRVQECSAAYTNQWHENLHMQHLFQIHPSLMPKAMQDGDRFWRIPETYIRGNTIKYLRVPDEVSCS